MPSRRRGSLPDPPLTVFFLDRGLGRGLVADMLRSEGHEVKPMADVYPGGLDQEIDDPTWIHDVSAVGWIALTKDSRLIRDHREALEGSSLRVFALDSSNLTGMEMAERIRGHLGRILHRAAKPGPYVYVLHHERIELRWRPEKMP